MAVRSDRLWGPVVVGSGTVDTELFVVPSGMTYLVKQFTIVNNAGVANSWRFDGKLGAGSQQPITGQAAIAAASALDRATWWAFDPTFRLSLVTIVTTGAIVCYGFGAKLVGQA